MAGRDPLYPGPGGALGPNGNRQFYRHQNQAIAVGSAVHVLPLVHPLRIAEEAATVDQISQGRFEFGVGRSGNIRAYDTMGIDYLESKDRFQEALEIIMQAFSGETFSYEGKYNHISNARLTPLPYTKPHPRFG